MIFELTECEDVIDYKFKNVKLFRQCFIHSSYTNEHPLDKDNERLEFFGDKIIDFVVTEYLYNTFPDEDEGRLTERRKSLVSKEPLGEVVFELGLNKYMILGKGVTISKDPSEKCYSSLYESVVAGIYLDGGLEPAKKFIYKTLLTKKRVKQAGLVKSSYVSDGDLKDYKSTLQEYIQKLKLGAPSYKTVKKEGPDNAPEFTESVSINGKVIALGVGKSKKLAQQQSAKIALDLIKKDGLNKKTTTKPVKKVVVKKSTGGNKTKKATNQNKVNK